MRGMMRLMRGFSTGKLSIADTANVIRGKILGITQVVSLPLHRMMSRSSEL